MENQNDCNKDCKKKRLEKIVNIIWTIVKIVGGMIVGHNLPV